MGLKFEVEVEVHNFLKSMKDYNCPVQVSPLKNLVTAEGVSLHMFTKHIGNSW